VTWARPSGGMPHSRRSSRSFVPLSPMRRQWMSCVNVSRYAEHDSEQAHVENARLRKEIRTLTKDRSNQALSYLAEQLEPVEVEEAAPTGRPRPVPDRGRGSVRRSMRRRGQRHRCDRAERLLRVRLLDELKRVVYVGQSAALLTSMGDHTDKQWHSLAYRQHSNYGDMDHRGSRCCLPPLI
jgi:hypothetical protein